MAQVENLVGKELDGIIIQERLRGQGATALYRGFSLQFKENVLLRAIWLNAIDDAINEKFNYEVERLKMLKHPNILPLRASGIAEGYGYVVFDFFRHHSLEGQLRDRSIRDFGESTKILTQVAAALGHAHARGIIHDDLHPSNILLDTNNKPYLTDLGLSVRLLGDNIMISREGIARLPSYTAPEHLQGQTIDPRANIYSLGAFLYHMTTGRPPFRTDGNLQAVIARHIHETPMRPQQINRAIPDTLQTVILKAIDKTPANRYQTTNSFIEDVDLTMRTLYVGVNILEAREAAQQVNVTNPDSQDSEARGGDNLKRQRHRVIILTGVFVIIALFYVMRTMTPLDPLNPQTPPAALTATVEVHNGD